ncbi:hypothetical protein BpHYR1_039917 [Brachionus plicatilis]|uniref:Uncharacterized protein n=1 Tax=Brachionus plicatilis TaxID=10195 RepID=A0A3M7QBS2_BRAPC|nr:hypothetical protein BpHYR1_039917 [Brachionus plicatilis]
MVRYEAILVEDMKYASDNFFFKYSYKFECADLEFIMKRMFPRQKINSLKKFVQENFLPELKRKIPDKNVPKL